MPVKIRILVLANSIKKGGHCIAGKYGKSLDSFTWIRPIADRANDALLPNECRCTDGGQPQVLDWVKIPLLRPSGVPPQSENWVIDPSSRWERDGKAPSQLIGLMRDPPEALWIDGFSSSGGINDRVPDSLAGAVPASLRLISVQDFQIRVTGHKVRGLFEHSGSTYILSVTDPIYQHHYRARGEGIHSLGNVFLTVSLGEDFGGYRYKLVAAIIEPGGGLRAGGPD